jgi:hypothetical protein
MQVIDRFDERSPEGMPGIASPLHTNQMPASLLRRLYDRIDTCPEIELDIIQRTIVASGLSAPALLTAHLDNFDVALQIVRMDVMGIEPDAAYATAMRDLRAAFTKLGMDSLPNYDITKARSDLHCARLLATGVNITEHDFEIKHEYHVELEAIRADIDFLRTAVSEFYQVKWAFRFQTKASEILEVTHYIHERESVSAPRVVDLITKRGSFDREVFDMIINNQAPAVSEGTL